MKKLLLSLVLLLLLFSCTSYSPEDFHVISDNPVDGYDIYEREHKGLFCNTYYEDIYYSGETYNYGFSYYGCSSEMTFFIKNGDEFIYLSEALEQGLITLESLLPELEQLERESEDFSSEEADYYWLDFHINHDVVYAYAGGVCDQYGTETFIINGTEYYYGASGCLQEHILFMEVNRNFVPVADLLRDGLIDGQYLIPLLTKSE